MSLFMISNKVLLVFVWRCFADRKNSDEIQFTISLLNMFLANFTVLTHLDYLLYSNDPGIKNSHNCYIKLNCDIH